MATKKQAVAKEDKLENQDFPLFDALYALDIKDYDFYDRLSIEQQRKFVPFMLIKYLSYIKGNKDISSYYLMSTEYAANKYFFNEYVQSHPRLQWLMLCAASPGVGKQFHPWLSQIKEKVSTLREEAVVKDVRDFYSKIYPKSDDNSIQEIAKAYTSEQRRKFYFAKKYPSMKYEDIEILNQLTSDEEIEEYERNSGNK
jgi:hypothetical protein